MGVEVFFRLANEGEGVKPSVLVGGEGVESLLLLNGEDKGGGPLFFRLRLLTLLLNLGLEGKQA